MSKSKITVSDILLTYIDNKQAEGVRSMVEAMRKYFLIDSFMWKEWLHLVNLLDRIKVMAEWDSPDFATRAKMLVQVLDEAREFDNMSEEERCDHFVKYGIQ